MKVIESEIVKCLTPLDLRAIYDLLCLLNMHFLGIDPITEPDEDEDNFISYFPEIDFSKMSDSLSSIETLNAIMNLKPEIKRFIFAKIISATQHILFWKTEREVVLYLFNLNFIEAKEVMMLNCSYVLRDLLPYSGCEYELTSDDFFDFEMKIKNEDNFHCYIYLSTGHVEQDGFINIFIDYDTVKRIRPYLYTPEGSINFISTQIDEKNYFASHGNYVFSYTKGSPSADAIRNGVWLNFDKIQLK